MARERDDRLDPTQPTLIVKSGNSARKYRPIEKEVLVLGRAPGCDLRLEAPEVTPVHCLIVRVGDGWRVRDCTGRGGTRLNGQSVQDEAVADEDVLQIGSFSFVFHLPAGRPRLTSLGAPASDAVLGRLQRARQNLARLAWGLRGRLRQTNAAVAERVEEQLAQRHEELDRQADELDALQSDLDARLGEMRQTRQGIAAESLALLQRHEQVEKELAERQAQSAAALAASLAEYQARRREAEEEHARTLAEQARAHQESVGDLPRALEIRARELGCYADHLRRTRQRLCDHEDSLALRWQEWLREQQTASEQLAREEAMLREQRSEVVRLMGEMRQLRQVPRPDMDALREEIEELRQTLAERDRALSALQEAHPPAPPPFELADDGRDLEREIRALQGRYADLEQAAREAQAQILRRRARFDQEKQSLEELHGGPRADEGRSPTQDTLVDMPSPLALPLRPHFQLEMHRRLGHVR